MSSIYILRISKKAPRMVLNAAAPFLAGPARFVRGLRPRAEGKTAVSVLNGTAV
jgi:hypothetical protein